MFSFLSREKNLCARASPPMRGSWIIIIGLREKLVIDLMSEISFSGDLKAGHERSHTLS